MSEVKSNRAWRLECESLRRELAAREIELSHAALTSQTLQRELAEARRDAERLDWIERNLIEGKWDGTIGRPKSWHMVGPYRHTLQAMRGNTLREAIDAATAHETLEMGERDNLETGGGER
jgi:hypothetical protein